MKFRREQSGYAGDREEALKERDGVKSLRKRESGEAGRRKKAGRVHSRVRKR